MNPAIPPLAVGWFACRAAEARGAPETGGGPAGGGLAAVLTALGLTGFLGGAGLAARRRGARR